MDVREDGTFAGLEDDGEDATGNSRALVSCDARPDQVVSHYAITPYAGRTTVPRQTGDNEDRPQGSTTDIAPRTCTAPQVSIQDDGTIAGLQSDEESDNNSKKHRSQSRAIVTTTKGNRSIRDNGTMAGLELDEENDNDSRKSRAIVTITKGNRSKSQVTTATATHAAEFVSDHRATQGSEHQDKDPQGADLKRGATYDSQDPQDDPQDVDLERGATNNSQDSDPRIPDLEGEQTADPLDSDPDRELQVNPQPLPASSHKADIPIDEIDGAEEHEMDERSHLGHDPETQIQIPIPEIPNDWQPPTTLCIGRELGPNPTSSGPDLSPTNHKLWRPSNPSTFLEYYWRPSNPSGAPEFDENGVSLGIDSDNEGNSCPQDP